MGPMTLCNNPNRMYRRTRELYEHNKATQLCQKCGRSRPRNHRYHYTEIGAAHWCCEDPTRADPEQRLAAVEQARGTVLMFGLFHSYDVVPVVIGKTAQEAIDTYADTYGIVWADRSPTSVRMFRHDPTKIISKRKNTMEKGKFIVLDGPDGSGKSTMATWLAKHIRTLTGRSVVHLREPGGCRTGERIRQLLLSNHGMPKTAELLLFVAARAALVEEEIIPALAEGSIVVCDRFMYSTVAYQAYGRGLSRKLVDRLNAAAIADTSPDLVLLLDVPPEVADARMSKRPGGNDRFDRESLPFRQRVRRGFCDQSHERECHKLINTDATPEEVQATLRQYVDPLFTSRAL